MWMNRRLGWELPAVNRCSAAVAWHWHRARGRRGTRPCPLPSVGRMSRVPQALERNSHSRARNRVERQLAVLRSEVSPNAELYIDLAVKCPRGCQVYMVNHGRGGVDLGDIAHNRE